MKKYILGSILIVLLFSCSKITSYKKEYARKAHADFVKYIETDEYDKAHDILQKWEKRDRKSPELYIDYFNYYINIGRNANIEIGNNPSDANVSILISDPETKETIGYIYDSTSYNAENVSQAIVYINKGLKYGEDRLDMYFGKVYILNDVGDYSTAAKTLIEVLEKSIKNKNRWLWENNEEVEDGEDFLLGNMNDYYKKWINVRTEQAIQAMEDTSKKQIELYPKNIYAYNFLAYSYILRDKKANAIPILLDAEHIDPSDIVIVNNLARLYEDTNNKVEAVKYWKKYMDLGGAEEKSYAQERIKLLGN